MMPIKHTFLLWGMAVALAVPALTVSAQADREDKGTARDFYEAGMAAAARDKYEEAAELLKQVKPEHPRYAKAMAHLAYQIYSEALGRGKEGLPFARKAFDADPKDPEVARAFVKTNVLSGVLFDPNAIARERPKTVAKEHTFLVTKLAVPDKSKKYPRAALEADLDYLEHVLSKCFAYLELRPVDYRGALDAIRLSLGDETPVNTFELSVAKLITLFCDGHARMHHPESLFLPEGCVPYAAGSHGGRVFLFNAAGDGFLDPKHPWVRTIDGKPIAEWMKVAGNLVVKESPQWHHRCALEILSYVNYLRAELGLPLPDTITLTLESDDRKATTELKMAVQRRPARRPDFPRGETRQIGEVGYFRLSRMTSSSRVLSDLDDWMSKFRNTKGLILDVRGNTGGTKSILHTLFPYFMKPGAPMRIIEATSYRLPLALPGPAVGGFAGSSMSGQAVGADYWKTDAERQQAAAFIKQFRPEWTPPAGKFSDWHVMGLDSKINPNAYWYDGPLILLQDSSTFSAGDIFVGAFEAHPNTTQIGTATGGGNGQMESYRLPNTGLGLVLCWSAKFRPNGKLYDGAGIPPDVVMEATPQDLFGTTDTVLDAALQRLK